MWINLMILSVIRVFVALCYHICLIYTQDVGLSTAILAI